MSRKLRRLEDAGTLTNHATALDAVGAGFDPAARAIDDGMDHLNIRLEDPRRDGRHVLTDTAGFLRLTTAEDVIATDLTLTANFATSIHSNYSNSCESRKQYPNRAPCARAK
jgi:hypothetical protein